MIICKILSIFYVSNDLYEITKHNTIRRTCSVFVKTTKVDVEKSGSWISRSSFIRSIFMSEFFFI